MPKRGVKPRIRIHERPGGPEYIEAIAHDDTLHFILYEDGPPQFIYLSKKQGKRLRKFLKEHGA